MYLCNLWLGRRSHIRHFCLFWGYGHLNHGWLCPCWWWRRRGCSCHGRFHCNRPRPLLIPLPHRFLLLHWKNCQRCLSPNINQNVLQQCPSPHTIRSHFSDRQTFRKNAPIHPIHDLSSKVRSMHVPFRIFILPST